MITKWVLAILAAIGLSVASRHENELAQARRRVAVSARWNRRQALRMQIAALDTVDRHQADRRPAQMIFESNQTRDTLAAVVERLK